MATKQQNDRTANPTKELTERPKEAERPRREASGTNPWFSFGDWRMSSTTEEWGLA